MKKIFIIVLITIHVISINLYANNQNDFSNPDFKDLPKEHWAYQSVMTMSEKGILKGYNDYSFKPQNQINRSEFATVLVKTLNLETKNPGTPSFIDVPIDSWFYKYIETAKYYLTGWKTQYGNFYKPQIQSVREDMAVAIVKALGIDENTADESILNDYIDIEQISPNLRKYIAAAIENGIMVGYKYDGYMEFKPQNALTRAEAAALLYNVLTENEEKITFDKTTEVDESMPYVKENETNGVPYVKGTVDKQIVKLNWSSVNPENFVYYKIVVSKSNATPKYPEDGYLKYYTDVNKTSIEIKAGDKYNNGDLGGYLKAEESYYFSVTAVYKDVKIPGNAIYLKMPKGEDESYEKQENTYTLPRVSGKVIDEFVKLNWDVITDDGFQGYKVVISKNNSTPKYPDDGYLFWITDKNKNYAIIDNYNKYNNGDFGEYLKSGEKYYFSVTAVYKDKKVAGNVIELIYP